MAWIDLDKLVIDCTEPQYLFAVYDAEGASTSPIYGVFTSRRKAEEAIEEMTLKFVEEILAAPVEESGVTEDDRSWLVKDVRKSFAIQMLHNGIDAIHYQCDIESPLA